jgi:DNA mismatch repair protein MutL
MGKIRKLPPEVISKIAAGQVVDRPASVVKELVENSLDAGAENIKVEIENAGKGSIKVIDDGCGMSEDDVNNCFLSHSTSKILKMDDLDAIRSLGFRGEALHSISSVSDVTIKSRLSVQDFGNMVSLSHGKVSKSRPVGMPVGTIVSVKNLFAELPARRKFLKSDQTEINHIVSVIMRKALAYPSIGFRLSVDGDLVLNYRKNQLMSVRLQQVLGKLSYTKLVEVFLEDIHVKVSGYVAVPQYLRRSKKKQFLYVNRRDVFMRKVTEYVCRGYGPLMDSSLMPVYVLFIDTPWDLVDVNIHPKKSEVHFVNESRVMDVVQRAVKQSLQKNDFTFVKEGFSSLKNLYVVRDLEKPEALKDNNFENVIQLHNMYLVTQTDSGVLFIDQHAAHERILYEELLHAYSRAYKKDTSLLPTPVTLELSSDERRVFEQYEQSFNDLGFAVEIFGKSAVKISKAPSVLVDRNISNIFLNVLDDLCDDLVPSDVDVRAKRALSYVACRSAIKSGDSLTRTQISGLLSKLANSTVSYACPHGRPLKIEIPLGEVNKMFERQ